MLILNDDREIRMFETISSAPRDVSNASLYGRMERMATTDGLTAQIIAGDFLNWSMKPSLVRKV